jgi:aspartate 1-decarboxylase
MIRAVLRSVIHNATVTHADASWPVSLRVDAVILSAASIVPREAVEVVDLASGYRFRTWAEPAEEGSGTVRVHAGSDTPIRPGNVISILCFGFPYEGQTLDHRARVVTLDQANRVTAVAEQ